MALDEVASFAFLFLLLALGIGMKWLYAQLELSETLTQLSIMLAILLIALGKLFRLKKPEYDAIQKVRLLLNVHEPHWTPAACRYWLLRLFIILDLCLARIRNGVFNYPIPDQDTWRKVNLRILQHIPANDLEEIIPLCRNLLLATFSWVVWGVSRSVKPSFISSQIIVAPHRLPRNTLLIPESSEHLCNIQQLSGWKRTEIFLTSRTSFVK